MPPPPPPPPVLPHLSLLSPVKMSLVSLVIMLGYVRGVLPRLGRESLWRRILEMVRLIFGSEAVAFKASSPICQDLRKVLDQ